MTQILSYTPSSPRFRESISRINYLHSRYGDRITNEQLVYVLGVFAVNPWIWAEKWEWRELNELEVAAMGAFWMGVGKMMSIDMEEIKGCGSDDRRYYSTSLDPSSDEDPTSSSQTPMTPKSHGWKDGLDWMIDMRAYMIAHEDQYLGSSPDVTSLVEETYRMVLDPFPRWMNAWMKQAISVMFEKRFREVSGSVSARGQLTIVE
jgi:hypothetical protein